MFTCVRQTHYKTYTDRYVYNMRHTHTTTHTQTQDIHTDTLQQTDRYTARYTETLKDIHKHKHSTLQDIHTDRHTSTVGSSSSSSLTTACLLHSSIAYIQSITLLPLPLSLTLVSLSTFINEGKPDNNSVIFFSLSASSLSTTHNK